MTMNIKQKIEILEFAYARLRQHYNEPEGVDFMINLRTIIDDTCLNADYDKFVLAVEGDTPEWMNSSGPMVLETMLNKSNACDIIKSGERFNFHGRNMVCRLEPLCSCEEFPDLLDSASLKGIGK